jgi:hypothetical protein
MMANHQTGGLLSVALSLISRSVGVTDHPVLWSPDFPLVDESTSDRLTNSILMLMSRWLA